MNVSMKTGCQSLQEQSVESVRHATFTCRRVGSQRTLPEATLVLLLP